MKLWFLRFLLQFVTTEEAIALALMSIAILPKFVHISNSDLDHHLDKPFLDYSCKNLKILKIQSFVKYLEI